MVGRSLQNAEVQQARAAYTQRYLDTFQAQNIDAVIREIESAGYQVSRTGAEAAAALGTRTVHLPPNVRMWEAYEELYHLRVAHEGFLSSEIGTIRSGLPSRIHPPGHRNPWGVRLSQSERLAAAEEIAIKRHILATHADILSEADRAFLQSQIDHLQQWGMLYGYY